MDVPVITVIDITEWSLLFVNGRLVDQGHETSLQAVERWANHEPFKLTVLYAGDTPLDKLIGEAGDAPSTMNLCEAVALIPPSRRRA